MLHTHHFAYGWVTIVIAYAMSFIGSLLGLQCARRARSSDRAGGWLIAAAIAIGGTGIWVMHFVAMLGFSIDGASIRYNVPLTLASAAIAVVVVWIGLSIVFRGRRAGRGVWTLLTGGVVTGLGVAAMHYSGMFALRTDATITYSPGVVALSVVIAIVASTAALWFTLHVRGTLVSVGAAIIMGIAVTGMHYTGMVAMHAHRIDLAPAPSGADGVQLLLPLMIGVSVVTMMLLINVGLTDNEGEDLRIAPATGGAGGPTGGLR
ncbi:MHYT domain-containing protein [Nocardia sp. BMG111209]|uniref:MHYT domain-containing protein n=1 Tax=Nocardia sp. BMG111209 TaxID=1160137 RepID=UPI0003A03992|nr:MHYT domain-containing protein [Nocardia sp. BMG111209]